MVREEELMWRSRPRGDHAFTSQCGRWGGGMERVREVVHLLENRVSLILFPSRLNTGGVYGGVGEGGCCTPALKSCSVDSFSFTTK